MRAARHSIEFKYSGLFDEQYIAPDSMMDGPNPLRPYYLPPSVDSGPNYSPNPSSGTHIGSRHATAPASSSFGSSARNILADMEYAEYLSESSPSPTDLVKKLLEQAVWKYTSIFLAQPFEVAKTVLQVQLTSSEQKTLQQTAFSEDPRRRPPSHSNDPYEVFSIQMGRRAFRKNMLTFNLDAIR